MSMDESLYRAPESSLERPVEGTARSLEDARAGHWDVDLGEVLSEAWRIVPGSKGVIWLGFALSMAASIVGQLVSGLGAQADSILMLPLVVIAGLAPMVVSYAVNGGTVLFGIKRAVGDDTASFDDVLKGFSKVVPVVLVMLLYGLAVVVGFFLLLLPGIYLLVGGSFALALVMERGLGVVEALSTSVRAVHHHWFKVAVTGLVAWAAAGFGSVVTLGIGAIWLLPFFLLVQAVLYREIFGYAGNA